MAKKSSQNRKKIIKKGILACQEEKRTIEKTKIWVNTTEFPLLLGFQLFEQGKNCNTLMWFSRCIEEIFKITIL